MLYDADEDFAELVDYYIQQGYDEKFAEAIARACVNAKYECHKIKARELYYQS